MQHQSFLSITLIYQNSARFNLNGGLTMLAGKDNEAIGRYWGSADVCQITEFLEGDAMAVFTWRDGAIIRQFYESAQEAFQRAEALGFTA